MEQQSSSRRRAPAPASSPGWTVEADLRSAVPSSAEPGADRLSGDFLVSSRVSPGRLGLVLVDVSGRGAVAGARAQRLDGVFGGLLDAAMREGFLGGFMEAANRHVLREGRFEGDDEGFATAVQLTLDLGSGEYELTGAGHPPAVLHQSLPRQTTPTTPARLALPVGPATLLPSPAPPFRPAVAGRGRGGWLRQWRAGAWRVLDDPEQGPALGLIPGAAFPSRTGRLGPGDAMLLYTDGLVESRRLDVDRGIDRLVRRAAAVLPYHRAGAATRIATAMRAEDGDDRALVVIRRHA